MAPPLMLKDQLKRKEPEPNKKSREQPIHPKRNRLNIAPLATEARGNATKSILKDKALFGVNKKNELVAIAAQVKNSASYVYMALGDDDTLTKLSLSKVKLSMRKKGAVRALRNKTKLSNVQSFDIEDNFTGNAIAGFDEVVFAPAPEPLAGSKRSTEKEDDENEAPTKSADTRLVEKENQPSAIEEENQPSAIEEDTESPVIKDIEPPASKDAESSAVIEPSSSNGTGDTVESTETPDEAILKTQAETVKEIDDKVEITGVESEPPAADVAVAEDITTLVVRPEIPGKTRDEEKLDRLLQNLKTLADHSTDFLKERNISDYEKINKILDKKTEEYDTFKLSLEPNEIQKKVASPEQLVIKDVDNTMLLEDEKNSDKQLKEQLTQAEQNENSVENKLSGNEVGHGTEAMDIVTGAGEGHIAPEHAVDPSDAAGAKPGAQTEGDHVMEDTATPNQTTTDGDVLMGTEVATIEDATKNDTTATTSANLMETTRMDLVNKSDAANDRREAKQKKTEEDARFKEQFTPQPIPGSESTIPDLMLEGADTPARDARNLDIDTILSGMQDITRGTEFGEKLTSEPQLARMAAENEARKLYKQNNVDIFTSGELIATEINSLASRVAKKQAGGGAIGSIPVFAPQASFGEIASLQGQHVLSSTGAERHMLLEELAPWYNEFRTMKVNRAVHEMEAMPTRIINSVTGSVQHGSKVRSDVSQSTVAFGDFMFWVLRDKLQPLHSGVTWDRFFKYTAAMGYTSLTQSQINWFITGNPDGDISKSSDEFFGSGDIRFHKGAERENISLDGPGHIDAIHYHIANAALVGIPTSGTPFPGKDVSPSAIGAGAKREYRLVDGRLQAVVAESASVEQQGQEDLQGIPSRVTNIPDPRFSERGGKKVPNVRIITIRNPNYDPKKKESDPGFEPQFITQEVPDIGVGSKEVGAEISKAQADRLLDNQPLKLYAPIHPQACDRYLGKKNYQRLSTSIEQYIKHYSAHGWSADDVQSMYGWNQSIMLLFGPTLYAFVTDNTMQRRTPIFTPATPDGVKDEYMELNELATELKKFQAASDDRADRVGDSGIGQKPLEQHLDNFFKDQEDDQESKLANMNAVIIALPDDTIPTNDPNEPANDPVLPPSPSGPGKESAVSDNETPDNNDSSSIDNTFGNSFNIGIPTIRIGAQEFDHGIRREIPSRSETPNPYGHRNQTNNNTDNIDSMMTEEAKKRLMVFRRLNRR